MKIRCAVAVSLTFAAVFVAHAEWRVPPERASEKPSVCRSDAELTGPRFGWGKFPLLSMARDDPSFTVTRGGHGAHDYAWTAAHYLQLRRGDRRPADPGLVRAEIRSTLLDRFLDRRTEMLYDVLWKMPKGGTSATAARAGMKLALAKIMKEIAIAGCTGVAERGSRCRIASYNLRFDIANDKGDNAWCHRRDRIIRVIRDGDFDLVGFQEMTDTMFPYLESNLAGYRFSKGRKGCGSKTIAYRPEKFELLDDGEFAISTTPDDFERKEWGCSSVRFGQFALFRIIGDGRMLRVINVHPDWSSQESRTEGMRQVLLEMVRKAESRGEVAVLMGDMNDDPEIPKPSWAKVDDVHPWGGSIIAAKEVMNDAFDSADVT